MTPIHYYFIGCVFIASLVIYESILLKKLQGVIKKTKLLTAISTIEFAWLIISGLLLYKFDLPNLTIIVPTLYILQNFMGWAYGFHLLKKSGVLEKIEENEATEITIPLQYTDFTLSFGIVYMMLSLLGLFFIFEF